MYHWIIGIIAFAGLGAGLYYTIMFIKQKGK